MKTILGYMGLYRVQGHLRSMIHLAGCGLSSASDLVPGRADIIDCKTPTPTKVINYFNGELKKRFCFLENADPAGQAGGGGLLPRCSK